MFTCHSLGAVAHAPVAQSCLVSPFPILMA
jgi:hypothetical protein